MFAIVGHERQEPGWPDRYIAHPRFNGFIEFKDVNTKSDAKQRIIIRELNRRGTRAYFVRHGVNQIEQWDHKVLAVFDGTAGGLLTTLHELDLDNCPGPGNEIP